MTAALVSVNTVVELDALVLPGVTGLKTGSLDSEKTHNDLVTNRILLEFKTMADLEDETFTIGFPVSEDSTGKEAPPSTFALTVVIPEGGLLPGEKFEKARLMVERVIFGEMVIELHSVDCWMECWRAKA